MRRARYQKGSLRQITRKDGLTVWEYRWRETKIDGTRERRSMIVGTLREYPTESKAQAAVGGLRLTINHPFHQGCTEDISVDAIPEPFRTAVFLDGASGLRVGELLGLKWEDVDFAHNAIYIRRSVSRQRIGAPKTEASQKAIPMNAELAKALRFWKMKTIYNRPYDWVYASPATNGKQPYWPNSIYRVYIKPAAEKIGLTKRIGWHTFRHTFGTILNANGENPKVIQELLRHANLKVTMDTYVQAVSDEKRKAQNKVVELLLPGIRKAVNS